MHWLTYLSYFFGGVSLINAVPHLVSGLQGRPFQSPFAKPPGKGLSSSWVNVVWGWFNLLVAYFLVLHVGAFDLRSIPQAAAVAVGGLVSGLQLARHFGRFHNGRL